MSAGDEGHAAFASRVFEVFDAVCDLPSDQRPAALDELCRGDAELRREVDELLDSDDDPLTGLDGPAVRMDGPAHPARIGEYEVLSVLGAGGMGIVYEAMQRSPHRKVALKLIRTAFLDDTHVRRFEGEAKVLGWLNHPGIATVYEAGTAELDGLHHPYLAMELVVGFPLDRYVRESRLSIAETIELVARVADAVHHAHQKGVIHRDLKPGNVLVDASGQPKVLDFGIARVTDADVTGATSTTTGGVLGTLPYMSPEQVEGDPGAVDTRADVYALGAVLYELLAGRKPLDVDSGNVAAAVRHIVDEEPIPLGRLDSSLRGDVELIAQKALEKERERRYDSAAELASDLRRYLTNEPIRARPVSTTYQLRKFARRNRGFVGAMLFAFASLIAGLCASLVLARREQGQRVLAEERTRALELQLYRQGIAEAQRELTAGRRERAREIVAGLEDLADGWELDHLRHLLARRAVKLEGHAVSPRSPVHRIRSDRSGSILASAAMDGSVRLWDPESGTCTVVLDPFGEPRRIDVTPDGRYLFALAWDGTGKTMTASLWEEDRLLHARSYPAERMGWGDCGFTPDGTLALWGWSDGVLRAWEVPTGRERYDVRVHDSDVRVLAIDSRGERVATGGFHEDPTIQLVDVRTGTIQHTLPAQESAVVELFFLRGGATLVSRSGPERLVPWDVRTGARGTPVDLSGEVVQCAVGDGAGTRFYAGTRAGSVVELDLDGDRPRVHDIGSDVLHLAPLGTPGVLGVGCADARVVLLDTRYGEVRGIHSPTFPGSEAVSALLPLPDGRGLVTGFRTGNLLVLPLFERPYTVLRGHESYVYAVEFTPDGGRLVSGGWDRTLRTWDAASLRSHTRSARPTASVRLPERILDFELVGRGERAVVALTASDLVGVDLVEGVLAWQDPLNACYLCTSPDGERTLASDSRGVVQVLASESGTRLASATWSRSTRAVAWDPEDRWVAGGEKDRLTLYDAHTLEVRSTVSLAGQPRRMAFSPDARWIAIGTREGTIEIVDTQRAEVVARLEPGQGVVYAVAFHPDGTRLASGALDGTVSLWATSSWTRLIELDAHSTTAEEPTYHYVHDLAFSPDGTRLASASGDHTLRLWEALPPAAGLSEGPPGPTDRTGSTVEAGAEPDLDDARSTPHVPRAESGSDPTGSGGK